MTVDGVLRGSDMSRDSRLTAFSTAATALALCSDRELSELVDAAVPLGSGIGGTSALLEVAGSPVFVKRVPLTDIERLPENVRSTANVFGLPPFCHYGVADPGSPGFGAWRELAVHTMTTNWVLAGQFDGFPLMYHWRVLPDPASSLPEELADVERAVAYWGGGAGMRDRLDALQRSAESIALFLEYIPQNLHDWLGERIPAGDRTGGKTGDEVADEAARQACSLVERGLEAGVSFMNARGLLHFDAHFENILTDGERLYFADYGLALSSRFELSRDHADFYERHRTYDRFYTVSYLVNWLVVALYGYGREEREALVRGYAEGERPTGIPAAAAAILARYSPVAAVMADFSRGVREKSRQTPYPVEELHRAAAASGLSVS